MSNVLTLVRNLAKLDPQVRRLAVQAANELAGDAPRRRRKNGRRKATAPARASKPRSKPAPPKPAPAPKAAAPRVRPKSQLAFEEED